MTTLNKIAYQVAEAAGMADNDTFIERARDAVAYYRALLIRREIERTGRTHPQLYQSIVVNLVKSTPVDACLPDLDCKVMRSEQKLPRGIRLRGYRSPFHYVGTVDNQKPFLYEEMQAMALARQNKFTKNMPRYSYADGYLYFINVAYDAVAVRGVFEDPLALSSFKACEGSTACSSPDDEYPVPADMVPLIIQSMLSGEFGTRAPNVESIAEVEINK